MHSWREFYSIAYDSYWKAVMATKISRCESFNADKSAWRYLEFVNIDPCLTFFTRMNHSSSAACLDEFSRYFVLLLHSFSNWNVSINNFLEVSSIKYTLMLLGLTHSWPEQKVGIFYWIWFLSYQQLILECVRSLD